MKQLLILSGKGGTGKTTVASAFVKLSQTQAFADCDVDAPNLHLVTQCTAAPQTDAYFGLPKAYIDPSNCISCGRCVQVCPPRSLKLKKVKGKDIPVFDLDNCIRCYCCQEHCPKGTIEVRPQLLNTLLSTLVKLFRR